MIHMIYNIIGFIAGGVILLFILDYDINCWINWLVIYKYIGIIDLDYINKSYY